MYFVEMFGEEFRLSVFIDVRSPEMINCFPVFFLVGHTRKLCRKLSVILTSDPGPSIHVTDVGSRRIFKENYWVGMKVIFFSVK